MDQVLWEPEMVSAENRIIAGGGFVEQERFGRRKLRAAQRLALWWSVISALTLLAMFSGATGLGVPGLAVLGASVLMPQIFFICRAIVLLFTDKPVSWIERVPSPEYEPRNLY